MRSALRSGVVIHVTFYILSTLAPSEDRGYNPTRRSLAERRDLRMSMSPDDLRQKLDDLRGELEQLRTAAKVEVTEKLCNPAPLGLAGFGLTTLLLNFVNADSI